MSKELGRRYAFPNPDVQSAWDELAEAIFDGLYAENRRGGEAREVVYQISTIVGVDLSSDIVDNETWAPLNMSRVTEKVRHLQALYLNLLASYDMLRADYAQLKKDFDTINQPDFCQHPGGLAQDHYDRDKAEREVAKLQVVRDKYLALRARFERAYGDQLAIKLDLDEDHL